MQARVILPVLIAAVAMGAFGIGGYASWWGTTNGMGPGAALSLAFLAIAAIIAVAAIFLHLRLVKPLAELAKVLSTQAQTSLDQPIEIAGDSLLRPITDAAESTAVALRAARSQSAEALEAATRRANEQRSRLEAILLDLSEGVVVCNLQHRVLLYNQSAVRMLPGGGALGLNRPLFDVLAREPVEKTLDMLKSTPRPPQGEAALSPRFSCVPRSGGPAVQARLRLVREADGRISGYVLTLADTGTELEALEQRDALLRDITDQCRRPLASLRSAVTVLAAPDVGPDDRRQLEAIVGEEAGQLTRRLDEVARRYQEIADTSRTLTSIGSFDVLRSVSDRLEGPGGIALSTFGAPVFVRAEPQALGALLAHLTRCIAEQAGTTSLEIETSSVAQLACFDISCDGPAFPQLVVNSWLDMPADPALSGETARRIVERHGGEVWSQRMPGGRQRLRVSLKAGDAPAVAEAAERQVPRPEYYDFDLFEDTDAALDQVPLRKVSFVVFDTETTGLRPDEGDELISIGAVRVVNGRILTGETFERLIDPGRDIPKASTRIHGISEDDVHGKPPAEVVLPQFKAFAGDAVLVAYNAAFDMRFLELKQATSGVVFDNPVLDPQLISIHLQPQVTNHSLGAIAGQLGVDVIGRHTALGDALTTAAVLVKLIDLAEARGIATYGQAIEISTRMMQQRKRLLHA